MEHMRANRLRSPKAVPMGAVMAVACALAAGCSSSTSSGSAPASSASAPGSSASAPTGSAVRVMIEGLGPDAPAAVEAVAAPEVFTVFKAAAEYVNAHGGAGGHKIQVDTCYDRQTRRCRRAARVRRLPTTTSRWSRR